MAVSRPPDAFRRSRYAHGEARLGLIERGMRAPWTRMEAEIFNVVTQHWDRGDRPLFSVRLRVAEQMLRAFDEAVQS